MHKTMGSITKKKISKQPWFGGKPSFGALTSGTIWGSCGTFRSWGLEGKSKLLGGRQSLKVISGLCSTSCTVTQESSTHCTVSIGAQPQTALYTAVTQEPCYALHCHELHYASLSNHEPKQILPPLRCFCEIFFHVNMQHNTYIQIHIDRDTSLFPSSFAVDRGMWQSPDR